MLISKVRVQKRKKRHPNGYSKRLWTMLRRTAVTARRQGGVQESWWSLLCWPTCHLIISRTPHSNACWCILIHVTASQDTHTVVIPDLMNCTGLFYSHVEGLLREDSPSISLTEDIWSSDVSPISLLSLTSQWIDRDFKLRAAVLHAQELRSSHCAAALVQKYNNMLQVWQISEREGSCCTPGQCRKHGKSHARRRTADITMHGTHSSTSCPWRSAAKAHDIRHPCHGETYHRAL